MAVGVDIGCGMCAIKIDGLYKEDLSKKNKLEIQKLIKKYVPLGNGQEGSHQKATKENYRTLNGKQNYDQ